MAHTLSSIRSWNLDETLLSMRGVGIKNKDILILQGMKQDTENYLYSEYKYL